MILFGLVAPVQAAVPSESRPIAVLRALDKITARVDEFEVTTSAPYHFGALTIELKSCRVTPPEVTPESVAFLQISELPNSGAVQSVFSGWMFASSPSLSAMEHPVYDIWLMGCKEREAN